MIMINCCAPCAYYNGDGLCNSRDSLNTKVHQDDGCDEWKEPETSREKAEHAIE